MGPPRRGSSVRYRVLIDGQPPGTMHGADIDDRTFEIEFVDPNAAAFALTFG